MTPWPSLRLCLALISALALPLLPAPNAAAQRLKGPAPARQTAAPAPVVPVRVLARLPHDAGAFTQGLLFHQGQLYESTGLYGQSSLRRVDPATGKVLTRHNLDPRFFGEGLALCPDGENSRLVQLTWREGVVLTYDSATLRPLASLALRGQGWGLACAGSQLVHSDGSNLLRWLDARTLTPTGKTVRVRDAGRPVERLNELEWAGGWLLANVWQEDKIAVIRPATGQVALWLDLSALRRELPQGAETANGIAYAPAGQMSRAGLKSQTGQTGQAGQGALYLTGKRWNTVFVVELPELMRQPPKR